jgi:Cof subfamily protein (haloacid dehalogenase superfamily)
LNIQLVVADIDGTFLDSAGEPSRGALDSIQKLRQQGIGFSLCSGRGDPGIRPFVELLGLDQPYIVSGGAAIIDPQDRSVISQQCLTQGQLHAVSVHGANAHCDMVFHTPLQLFVVCSDAFWQAVCESKWINVGGWQNLFRARTWQEMITKPVIRIDFFNQLDQLPRLAQEVENLVENVHAYHMPHNLEISDCVVDKGAALRQLADFLKIPIENVLSIGDNVNDISMLEAAGVGVAMRNASLQVIRQADYLAPSCDEGGLASVINHLLSGTMNRLRLDFGE